MANLVEALMLGKALQGGGEQMRVEMLSLSGLQQKLMEAEISAITMDRETKVLSLPENMSYETAIAFLQRKKEEEEQKINVDRVFETFPFDGAHAFTLAMQEMFNFSVRDKGMIETPYGNFEFKPQMIRVFTEFGKYIDVPWGGFLLPGMSGNINTGFALKDENRVVFRIFGEIKGRERETFNKLADLTEQKLREKSIYKGKAFKIAFRKPDGTPQFFDPNKQPEFMDLKGPIEPIFNKLVDDQINLSIINPIKHRKKLLDNGVHMRRAVLLEGGFGSGKTLTALKVARLCEQEGVTFIYSEYCEDLEPAIKMAQQYSPSVVFLEDVDRAFGNDESKRNATLDRLSYILDGLDTKAKDILIVMTTNNVKGIQRLMLRPGRIDSVISIESPDADCVHRMVEKYAAGTLQGTKVDFADAIKPMVGQSAAFISEAVNKARLNAIVRDGDLTIRPDDVKVAVKIMDNHVRLMKDGNEPHSVEMTLGDVKFTVPVGIGETVEAE